MNSKIFEITHDSLAAKIWEKISAEEKALIEVRNFINSSYNNFQVQGDLLSKKNLAYIAPYEGKLAIDDNTAAFITRSKRRYRNRRIVLIAGTSLVIVFLATSLMSILIAYKEREIALSSANKSSIAAKNAYATANQNAQKATEMAIRAEAARSEAEQARKNDSVSAHIAQIEKQSAINARIDALKATQLAISASTDSEKQRSDTKKALEITQLLLQDPTASLKESIAVYPTIQEKQLKNIIRLNVYDAYEENLYEKELTVHSSIKQIAITKDLKHMLIGNNTNVLQLWDLQKNTVKQLFGHLSTVTTIASSPSNNQFVSVGNYREAIMWDAEGNYQNNKTFDKDVLDIRYMNDGRQLLVGYKNGILSLLDKNGNEKIIDANRDSVILQKLIVTKNNSLYAFITYTSDDKVRLWHKGADDNFTSRILDFKGNTDIAKITAISLSSDNKLLAIGTEKGIYIANIDADIEIIPAYTKLVPSVTSISFRDSQEMLIATANGNAYIYKFGINQLKPIKGQHISCLETTENKDIFLTGGEDRKIKMWNTSQNNPVTFKSKEYLYDQKDFVSGNNRLTISEDNDKINFFSTDIPQGAAFSINSKIKKEQADTIAFDSSQLVLRPVLKMDGGIQITEQIELLDNNVLVKKLVANPESNMEKIDIVYAKFSDCKKFFIMKLKNPGLRFTYYKVFPTFWGVKYFVKNL